MILCGMVGIVVAYSCRCPIGEVGDAARTEGHRVKHLPGELAGGDVAVTRRAA